jgi:hypothetical protein
MPRQFNSDNRAAAESLRKLVGFDAQLVLPGHGDPFQGTPAQAVELAGA